MCKKWFLRIFFFFFICKIGKSARFAWLRKSGRKYFYRLYGECFFLWSWTLWLMAPMYKFGNIRCKSSARFWKWFDRTNSIFIHFFNSSMHRRSAFAVFIVSSLNRTGIPKLISASFSPLMYNDSVPSSYFCRPFRVLWTSIDGYAILVTLQRKKSIKKREM